VTLYIKAQQRPRWVYQSRLNGSAITAQFLAIALVHLIRAVKPYQLSSVSWLLAWNPIA